jgi:pSer/pThr/pTyr-binding forkhead associated (FHA) protein
LIKCPNCGKQNQDHYKFCLGCGSELPRDATRAPAPTAAPTPPSGIPVAGKPPSPLKVEPKGVPIPIGGPTAARMPARPPSAPAMGAAPSAVRQPSKPPPAPTPSRPPAPPEKKGVKCSACGADVPPDFKFCGRCGAPLAGAPVPPVPVAAEPPRPEVAVRGKLVMIQPSGAEGVSVPLTDTGIEIGRAAGDAFKDDYFLSPKHARFTIENNQLFVEDLGSLNGIYFRLLPEQPYEILSGDYVRIGQEVVRFEVLPEAEKQETPVLGSPRKDAWGKISLVLGKTKSGNAFTIDGNEGLIGRERGNVIFPDDGYVSGLHLKISKDGPKYFVTDLKSSNGSYVKIRDKKEVRGGDYLLVGQFLYRVDF